MQSNYYIKPIKNKILLFFKINLYNIFSYKRGLVSGPYFFDKALSIIKQLKVQERSTFIIADDENRLDIYYNPSSKKYYGVSQIYPNGLEVPVDQERVRYLLKSSNVSVIDFLNKN